MAIIRPKTPAMSPLRRDLPDRPMTMVRPSNMREKYSGGPKSRAMSARGGANSRRPNWENVPAMKDAMAAIPRAGPARPFLAIW